MTGAVIATGQCVGCGDVFSFHPDRVPSVHLRVIDGTLVSDLTGPRYPLCRPCVENVWNPARMAAGKEPLLVYPDSYGTQQL